MVKFPVADHVDDVFFLSDNIVLNFVEILQYITDIFRTYAQKKVLLVPTDFKDIVKDIVKVLQHEQVFFYGKELQGVGNNKEDNERKNQNIKNDYPFSDSVGLPGLFHSSCSRENGIVKLQLLK